MCYPDPLTNNIASRNKKKLLKGISVRIQVILYFVYVLLQKRDYLHVT